MFPVLLAWIAFVFLVVRFFFHGLVIIGVLETLGILAILFIVLMFWTVHRITSPAKKVTKAIQRQAAAARPSPAADDSGTITFRVAGVTFDNDDGTSRQEILRHIKFGDSPYADDMDPDDLSVTIEETTYDGAQAFEVYANGYQIGFVPKALIRQVAKAKSHIATCYVSTARITGGGFNDEGQPMPYGCEVNLEY